MSEGQEREFEEGAAGTKSDRKKDPLKEYDEKEAMSPAKLKEHEPTAVKRDPSDQKIVEVLQVRVRLVANMNKVPQDQTNK
jgi:hypothetical protein